MAEKLTAYELRELYRKHRHNWRADWPQLNVAVSAPRSAFWDVPLGKRPDGPAELGYVTFTRSYQRNLEGPDFYEITCDGVHIDAEMANG